VYAGLIVAILCMGVLFNLESLNGVFNFSEEITGDPISGKLQHFALQDAVPAFEEQYGYTAVPNHQPLEVHASDDPAFEYMAHTPYYKVYFKGNIVHVHVGDAWIEFELTKMRAENTLEIEKRLDTIPVNIDQN
jgi:hypothetical protein